MSTFNASEKNGRNWHDLEPQQYEPLIEQEDVPLGDVRKSALRWLIYLTLLFIAGIIFWGNWIKYPNQIKVDFSIKDALKEKTLQFDQNVTVLNIYVEEGAEISQGDALLKITSRDISGLIMEINKSESELEFSELHDSMVQAQRVNILATNVKGLSGEIKELKYELDKLQSEWRASTKSKEYNLAHQRNFYSIQEQLYNDGIIAQAELDNFKKELVNLEDEFDASIEVYEQKKSRLQLEIRQKQADIAQIDGEVKKIAVEYQRQVALSEKDIELAQENLAYHFGDYRIEDNGIVILSGWDGVVSFIRKDLGQIESGDVLIRMREEPLAYYAGSEIDPAQIGKIKKLDPVVLKVSSFPHYEWGVLDGRIVNLSSSPNEEGKYYATINIAPHPRISTLLQNGMTGEASITIEEKTFFGYLFRNLKKQYAEMTD